MELKVLGYQATKIRILGFKDRLIFLCSYLDIKINKLINSRLFGAGNIIHNIYLGSTYNFFGSRYCRGLLNCTFEVCLKTVPMNR